MSEASSQAPRETSGVYLVIKEGDNALFMHRFVGYQAGNYMLPGGTVENESPTDATVRETLEELGLSIKSSDLILIHVMYRAPHDETGSRVDWFFETPKGTDEPQNMEPHKCDELSLLSLNDLPENIPTYVKIALKNAREGIMYSEFGWSDGDSN